MEFYINKHYKDDRISQGKWLFNERKSKKAMKLPSYKFCEAMSALCTKVASGDSRTFKASQMRTMFKGQFAKNEQHDANEFIVSLFSKLQDEQTPKSAKFVSDEHLSGYEAWKAYKALHKSLIDNILTGMTQTEVKCHRCKNISYNFECFNNIHLSCNYSSLEKAYKEYLSDEILTKDQMYK